MTAEFGLPHQLANVLSQFDVDAAIFEAQVSQPLRSSLVASVYGGISLTAAHWQAFQRLPVVWEERERGKARKHE